MRTYPAINLEVTAFVALSCINAVLIAYIANSLCVILR